VPCCRLPLAARARASLLTCADNTACAHPTTARLSTTARRLALALAALMLWAVISKNSSSNTADGRNTAALLHASAEDNLGITAARAAAAAVEEEERKRLGPAKGAPSVKGAKKERAFPPQHIVNIMDWVPPRNAPEFDKALWKDKVDDVWAEVRAFTLGGPPLRKFISQKVAGLKALRKNLFAFVPVLDEEEEGGLR